MSVVPFGFKDRLMEERYQQHFIASVFDRISPVMRCCWLPVYIVLRCLWIIYWFLFPSEVTPIEIVVNIARFFVWVLGVVVVSKKWDASSQSKIGLYALWIARTSACLVALQQAAAKENDPQIMAALVSFICLSGMLIPSFTEYLCAALPLPYIQPIRLHLSGGKAEHIQEIVFQHSLILALGLSITWTIHADCRRNWLRFPSAFKSATAPANDSRAVNSRERRKLNKEVLASAAHASANSVRDWDQLEDGYFTDADRREMRAEALLVSL